MSIALLRAGTRAWLESQTRIDAWDLDLPANVPTVLEVGTPPVKKRYAANSAIELPVERLKLQRVGNQIEGTGEFGYVILYRFSGKASKEQLPVKAVENSVNYLLQEAIAYPQDLWEGIRAMSTNVDAPVTIARTDGEDKDWLIIARLEFDIRFASIAEPDEVLQPPLPPEPPTQLNQLAIAVNRSLSPVTPDDPATYTEDTRIILATTL